MVGLSAEVVPDSLYRKVGRRILPLLVACYVFAYIDRVNIGFAKLQMTKDIGISESVYGTAAGVFFLGYVLFEVPSNLLLQRIGTRRTLSRIMLLWGLTSAAMLFVHDATGFYVLRFLLGVFEAGFAPGIIFSLTYWFPPARMAAAMSVLMIPGPLGSMIGGPLSSLVMSSLDGVLGRVYSLALGYFCLISGLYAVSFWLPTILKDNGVAGTVHIGLWTAVPYAFSLILMFVLSRRSDRRGERRLHSAIPALVSALALAVAALTAQTFVVSMIAMVLATAAMWGSYTIFWAIPSGYLADTAAAGGIALINSIGLLGGFFSPTLIGYVKEATGSTEIGLLSMAALLVLGGSLILITKLRKEMS